MISAIDHSYAELVNKVQKHGFYKNGTTSLPGATIEHYFEEGFPLLASKKMAFNSIVHELIWFIQGDTTIGYLVQNDVNIWTDNAYEHYKKRWSKIYDVNVQPLLTKEEYVQKVMLDKGFNARWGDLGPVYGKQWRSWMSPYGFFGEEDQLAAALDTLLTQPDSRSILVSSWAVHYLPDMALKPCHVLYQFHVHKDKDGESLLSLTWYQRSVDVFLGLPFNIASYGILLQAVAQQLDMTPYKLQGFFGDVHIYEEHSEAIEKQLNNIELNPKHLNVTAKVEIEPKHIFDLTAEDIRLTSYQSYEAIKAPMIVTNKA